MILLRLLSPAKYVLPIFLFLASCAGTPEKLQAKPESGNTEETKPTLVGRVSSIPADRKFILIQAYGNWKIPTGAILATLGPNGRAANLRVTGEKLGQFAAADIQSGNLEVGDGVYTTITRPASDPSQDTEAPPEEL